MPHTPTVIALSGSLRDRSYTRAALYYALDAAARAGAETDLVDLRTLELPVFDPDDREVGDAEHLKRTVREADGVLMGTPVYHGSYSGALKNAHDYCGHDEFEDTVVGLLATAGGSAYSSTLDHLRSTVRGVHGWVIPHQVGIESASDAFEDDPDAPDHPDPAARLRFTDESLADRTATLGRKVAEHAGAGRIGPTARARTDD